MDKISEHLVGEAGPEPITAEQLATAVIARAAHDDDCGCDGEPGERTVRKARVISAALAKAGLLGITVRDATMPEGICGAEAPTLVGCTSMHEVCSLRHGHASEWHEADGGVRWKPGRPRSWSLPVIPDDVTRVSAVGGDLVCEREPDDPRIWLCRSRQTGRVLAMLWTRDLLAQYSPLTEVTEEQP